MRHAFLVFGLLGGLSMFPWACRNTAAPTEPRAQQPFVALAPDASATRTPSQVIPPLIDESSAGTCFVATLEELQVAAPGWLLPSPNLQAPTRRDGTNPFTGEPIVYYDYRNPQQPTPPRASGWPDVQGLPRVETVLVQPFYFAALVHAIQGASEADAASQLFGQQLISAADADETLLFLVPEPFVAAIVRLGEIDFREVASRWHPEDEGEEPPELDRLEAIVRALQRLLGGRKPKAHVFLSWAAD